MVENLSALESAQKVVSIPARKNKEVSVKDLCKDEDIATLFRLVCQYDLRKEAIESIEKRLYNIKAN